MSRAGRSGLIFALIDEISGNAARPAARARGAKRELARASFRAGGRCRRAASIFLRWDHLAAQVRAFGDVLDLADDHGASFSCSNATMFAGGRPVPGWQGEDRERSHESTRRSRGQRRDGPSHDGADPARQLRSSTAEPRAADRSKASRCDRARQAASHAAHHAGVQGGSPAGRLAQCLAFEDASRRARGLYSRPGCPRTFVSRSARR